MALRREAREKAVHGGAGRLVKATERTPLKKLLPMNAQYVVHAADSQALAAEDMFCLGAGAQGDPLMHRRDSLRLRRQLRVHVPQCACGNAQGEPGVIWDPHSYQITDIIELPRTWSSLRLACTWPSNCLI